MIWTNVAVGLAIAIGLCGIIVPVLPGALLVLGALIAWAVAVGSPAGWVVFAVSATFLVVGQVVKYTIPGKRLAGAGIPNSTLLLATLLGLIGFFVIPLIGLFLGFVLGIYLAELRRLGREQAWPSTVHALKAVGISIMIEFASAMLAALTWGIGLFFV